ncbi:MAG TPA: ROK family protein [Candidatus Faecimonas gallistercoris]|nr:ROK family protein [Candidatus Faecimonas gallistercoris]
MYALGIDIGASHIGLGIYDTITKRLIKTKYIKYDRPFKIWNYLGVKRTTMKYIRFLKRNIDEFIGENKIEKIGVGCPGGVDCKNGIFFGSKALVVGKIDFRLEFEKYHCPVYVENDANCAAVGVVSGSEENTFLMITIGTGVGFSLVKNENSRIILAEDPVIWKILDANKVPGTKHDKYISSFKRLSKKYNQQQHKKLPREEIFCDIENGHQLIDDYIDNFVIGIKKINRVVPIKNICLGGSFSMYHKYYLEKVQKELPDFHIFISSSFNDAGIIGAALLPVLKDNSCRNKRVKKISDVPRLFAS